MSLVYPSGKSIKQGDYVWREEGIATGYIDKIYSDTEGSAASGYAEPSIIINLFPPGMPTRIYMGYPHSCLEEEGIDLILDQELREIESAKGYIENLTGIAKGFLVAFKGWDECAVDRFPLLVACYGETACPIHLYKIAQSAIGMTHCDSPLSLLPGFAWPIRGGGPA